ncbi:MAG: hypothetical protein JOY86_06400 [Candidatus Eremiobacteraeota bacterium]|nr:hypothetical protein [Candidatus Eremiobacteraeota bacterium]
MMTLVSVLLVGQLMAGTQGAPAATPAPLATPCAVAAPNKPAGSCPTQSPKKIGAVVTTGRAVNIVGKALASSTGTISAEQIVRKTKRARHDHDAHVVTKRSYVQ